MPDSIQNNPPSVPPVASSQGNNQTENIDSLLVLPANKPVIVIDRNTLPSSTPDLNIISERNTTINSVKDSLNQTTDSLAICAKPKSFNYPFVIEDSLSNKNTLYVERQQIYGSSSIKEGSSDYSEIAVEHTNEWSGALASIVIIVALLLMYYTQGFTLFIFKMLTNFSAASVAFDENSLVKKQYSNHYVWFSILVCSAALLSLVSNWITEITFTPSFYLITFLVLSGIWLIQQALYSIAGEVCMNRMLFLELKFTKKLLYSGIGILILPFILVLMLHNQEELLSLYLLTSLFGIWFVFLVFRSLIIFIRSNISIFFWFLYLCLFEIGPFVLLYIVFQHNTRT